MTRSISLVVGILLLGAAVVYPVVRRDTLQATSSGMLINGPLVVTGETEFDSGQSLGTGTVTTTEILDATVSAADLGTDSVSTDEIATDGVGAAEIAADAVGTSEIATNAIGAAELITGSVASADVGALMMDKIIFCGNSFNATTGYLGPAATAYLGGGAVDLTMGGTACDAIPESTIEATADEPIATNFPAFKVHGLYCRASSDPTADIVVAMRSAAAATTPAITCTIAGTGAATHCRALTSTTVDIAAGATVAVQVVTGENLSAQDVWCEAYFSIT